MAYFQRSEIADWHPADVVAALRKSGWSMRKLASSLGFHPGSFSQVTQKVWPRAQAEIAKAIGVPPQEIWPSRYETNGTPKTASQVKRNRGGPTTQKNGEAP